MTLRHSTLLQRALARCRATRPRGSQARYPQDDPATVEGLLDSIDRLNATIDRLERENAQLRTIAA